MTEFLEDVIADERGQAAVLRMKGHAHDAELVERLCDRIAAAAVDHVTWISEADATMRSGNTSSYLRARYPELEAAGLAKLIGRKRYYRKCAIPQRRHEENAREAGRRAARSA